MQKATTDRADYVFKASEYGDEEHTPWITTEPRDRGLKILGGRGFIGLDLKPGTSFAQAREIAEYLNSHVGSITCTMFED